MKNLFLALYHYLLLSSTIAFIAGIALSYLGNIHLSMQPYLLAAASALTFLLVVFIRKDSKVAILAFTLAVAFILGIIHGNRHLQVPSDQDHIFHLLPKPEEAVITGVVEGAIQFDGRFSKTDISLQSITFKDVDNPLPAKGKIALSMAGPWPPAILPGDIVMARASLKPVAGVKVPGVFSYETYQARREIYVTGFVRSKVLIRKIGRITETPSSFLYAIERLRTGFGHTIDTTLPAEQAALYRAILLGDRSALDEETLEIFKRCGVFHILAVSGLHMSVLGGLLYLFFRWLVTRASNLLYLIPARKPAVGFTLPVLVVYAFLAGGNPPVLRAVIMSSCVIIAICINRMRHSLSLVAFAALSILLFDPAQLFSISFQLSFTAVIAIIIFIPEFTNNPKTEEQLFQRIKRWLIGGCLVSIIATTATAPLMLHSFNRLSLIAPAANLLFEPLICYFALPLGLLALPFYLGAPPIADFLLSSGGMILHLTMKTGELLSRLPLTDIRLPPPSPAEMVTYYTGLLICVSAIKSRKIMFVPGLIALVISIISFLGVIALPDTNASKNMLEVTYVDVGQGSSNLVRLPNHQTILIDGGSSSFLDNSLGEKVLAPFLWSQKIKKLDVIIITHPDADHFNGLQFILHHIPTQQLWVRDTSGHSEEYEQLIEIARQAGVEVIIPRPGMKLGNEAGYAQIISSPHSISTDVINKNNSLITKVCAFRNCFLFPGDIEADFEQELVNTGVDLSAAFLLAPHHGSATSTSDIFLDNVKPELIVVSAGTTQKAFFPAAALATRCRQRGIELVTTPESGTITIRVSERGQREILQYGHIENNFLYPMEYLQIDTASQRNLKNERSEAK